MKADKTDASIGRAAFWANEVFSYRIVRLSHVNPATGSITKLLDKYVEFGMPHVGPNFTTDSKGQETYPLGMEAGTAGHVGYLMIFFFVL